MDQKCNALWFDGGKMIITRTRIQRVGNIEVSKGVMDFTPSFSLLKKFHFVSHYYVNALNAK